MAKTTHREVEDDPIDYEIICPGNERTSFSRQHHLRAIALYNHTVPHSYRLVLCAKMDYLERLIGIAMPNFSGQNFREEQVEEIGLKWLERWCDLCTQFSDSCDVVRSQGGENVTLPPGPLKVLPETTYFCITRDYCYHREYMTSDTSQSKCQWTSTIQDPVVCVSSMCV